MIDEANVIDLVAQYAKHGWQLERILLAAGLFAKMETALKEQFGPGVILRSTVDAVWFSRPNGDKISWEIRRLTGAPFALVRFVPADATDADREEILKAAEAEIADSLSSSPTEH